MPEITPFQALLLVATILTWVAARGVPRSGIWIGALALSFIGSTAYVRLGGDYGAAFAIACDAPICLAIYFIAREKWELRLFQLLQTSVLINIMYLGGAISYHWLYISALEAINWLALVLIGGVAILDRIAAYDNNNRFSGHWHRSFHLAVVTLRSPRSSPPWSQNP